MTLQFLDIPGLECASENVAIGEVSINCLVRDVWEQKFLGIYKEESMEILDLKPHDCAFFIVETPIRIEEDASAILQETREFLT